MNVYYVRYIPNGTILRLKISGLLPSYYSGPAYELIAQKDWEDQYLEVT